MKLKHKLVILVGAVMFVVLVLFGFNQLILKPHLIQQQLWEKSSWIDSYDEIFEVRESDLSLLPNNHPLRGVLEIELEQDVRENIETARYGEGTEKMYASWLLGKAMRADPDQWENSFAQWIARRGILLGTEQSYNISMRICIDMNFTVREADDLYEAAVGQ